MTKAPDNFLHVYGQYMWHDDAVIRGTRSALTALRDAIDAALSEGQGIAEVFATDGEGYAVGVSCVSTIASVGQPEYTINLEHAAAERSYKRKARLAEPATGWEVQE